MTSLVRNKYKRKKMKGKYESFKKLLKKKFRFNEISNFNVW